MNTSRKRITFHNTFHNTKAVSFAKVMQDGTLELSDSQVRRASRKLCGMSDCECGTFRGPICDDEGDRYYWDYNSQKPKLVPASFQNREE